MVDFSDSLLLFAWREVGSQFCRPFCSRGEFGVDNEWTGAALTLLFVSVVSVVSLLAVAARSWTLLVNMAVLFGFLQAPLVSWSRASSFQYLDDVSVLFLIFGAVLVALRVGGRVSILSLVIFVGLVCLSGLELYRSPDVGVGISQFRQVVFPLGLAFSGAVLRDRIKWSQVWRFVALLGVLAGVWILVEFWMQAPLVDPVWYYINAVGADPRGLRQGLPPSYWADTAAGTVIFRPGGPFMNPPIAGFLLGGAAFATASVLRGAARIATLLIIGGSLAVCYARAGIVIFAVVIVVFLIWAYVGRFAGLIVVCIGILFAIETFLEQGNTASHTDGLISGFLTSVRSPLGVGFGVTGYQASLEGAAVGAGAESLLGLYWAWLGWSMLLLSLAVSWVLWRRLRLMDKTDSRVVWFAISVMVTAAVSESASSIASTVPLWLVLGLVLSGVGPGDSGRRDVCSSLGQTSHD